MTLPHRYLENQFVKLSRGTLNGLPLLMPGKNDKLCNHIREIFKRDASRFNITLLALNVEPFGYEAIIFDPKMRRSDFIKSVNQSISMKVKKSIDHRESVWSNRKPGNVPILDLKCLENEIFEVCISPVKKGYVRTIGEWVLPYLGPETWEEEVIDEDSKTPKDQELSRSDPSSVQEFTLPKSRGPGVFKSGGEWEKIGALKSGLLGRISDFEAAEKGRRKKVFGAKTCRKKATFLKNSKENHKNYSAPKQAFLATCGALKNRAIACLKAYYIAYRKALVVFIKTKKSIFPAGVLKMRTLFGVASFPPCNGDPFHLNPSRRG